METTKRQQLSRSNTFNTTRESQFSKLTIKHTKEKFRKKCSCAHCGQIYTEPKRLICDHTFCSGCLNIVRNRFKENVVICYECNKACPKEKLRDPSWTLQLILKQWRKSSAHKKTISDDLYICNGRKLNIIELTMEEKSEYVKKNETSLDQKSSTSDLKISLEELKKLFVHVKRLLTKGLDVGIQGAYINRKAMKIILDIGSNTENAVKTFLRNEIETEPSILNHIDFHQYETGRDFIAGHGKSQIESGSMILEMKYKDSITQYNATDNSDEKAQILVSDNTQSCTLGCFAQDRNNREKKYILSAMHLIHDKQKGSHTGDCDLTVIVGNPKKAYKIAARYQGWIGGYVHPSKQTHQASPSEQASSTQHAHNNEDSVIFLDLAAFEFIGDIPNELVNYFTYGEMGTKKLTTQTENADCRIDVVVQKWGAKTELTFGEIDADLMDYSMSLFQEVCGGIIRIKSLNKEKTYFAQVGDSGSLITGLMEPKLFRKQCPDGVGLLRAGDTNPETVTAYGILSQACSNQGYAIQLEHGLAMLKEEFKLDLELCNP